MGYTKRQFIEAAFEEIGLAAYTFDLQPEQIESALRRLDAMMATWDNKGLKLSYPIPYNPENSNLDDVTDVPVFANEAIILALAVRIAPSYGKQVSPDTKAAAKSAYDALMSLAAYPREKQLPQSMPAGAGYKNWDQVFLEVPNTDPIQNTNNGLYFNS
jgi:hypothetical protein